jgi:ssDNA-binding Zn-finger/Zn-ribbon topoisomerase 1
MSAACPECGSPLESQDENPTADLVWIGCTKCRWTAIFGPTAGGPYCAQCGGLEYLEHTSSLCPRCFLSEATAARAAASAAATSTAQP